MYIIMVLQMLYVFTGNIVHELLGIGFFIALVTHIVIKRKWFKAVFSGKTGRSASRRFGDIVTLLLLLNAVVLMLSSMGVSRTLFPWFSFVTNVDLHRYLATSMLTLALVHGGMHCYYVAKNKRRAVILIVILAAAGIATGLALVPYINRHFRKVEIDLSEKTAGEKLELTEQKPLVVYFTRLGNTDFEEDVDAVSGASLMKIGDEYMGNTELLALMVKDAIDCEIVPITVIGEKYPSSYSETTSVARKEIKDNVRPAIREIDISEYDKIILSYPIWWGTVPAPVATFLENNDLSGKTVYLLATQGSAGFASSTRDVERMAKGAQVIEGLSIYSDDIPDARAEIAEWLKSVFE